MALWQHLHVLQSGLQKLNFIFDLRFAWVLRSCGMLIAADWTFPVLVERGLILSRNSRGEHTIGAFAFAERGLSWGAIAVFAVALAPSSVLRASSLYNGAD